MIPALGAEQVLQTLAGFKEYATTGTLLVLELVGTFVFALSGATAGVKHRLDLFGVLVVSFATATAGGITRDVLIGAVPPAALRDWRYLVISMLAGLVVFFWSPRPERQRPLRNLVLTFDAAGLALFAVSGTQKALAYDLDPVMAALLGMLTGIGGGMLRDVLVSDIPAVLHSDLYCGRGARRHDCRRGGPRPERSGCAVGGGRSSVLFRTPPRRVMARLAASHCRRAPERDGSRRQCGRPS